MSDRWEMADELARDVLAALEAAGFAVVPREPTEAMLEAGWHIDLDLTGGRDATLVPLFRAMIAAAPTTGYQK